MNGSFADSDGWSPHPPALLSGYALGPYTSVLIMPAVVLGIIPILRHFRGICSMDDAFYNLPAHAPAYLIRLLPNLLFSRWRRRRMQAKGEHHVVPVQDP